MIALILDKNNSVIQSMNRATIFSIKNYFNINKDSETAITIDREKEIEGDITLESERLLISKKKDFFIEKIKTGSFNFDYYSTLLAEEISDNKIIANLIHVYNGGSLDTVPYLMSYEEKYIEVETKFEIIEIILDFKKYNKEEILKM
jgi:hypothetical protein